MFQTAAGFKNFGMFIAPCEGASFPRGIGKGGCVGIGAPVGVDDELFCAVVGEVFERVDDERLICNGDEGFWAPSGEGFEAGAEAGPEHKGSIRGVHGSIDPELSFAVTRDAFGTPWRVPNEFDFGSGDSR